MSKGRDPRKPRPRPSRTDAPIPEQKGDEPPFPLPLKPRRTLFIILALLVAAWLIALLVIYFVTVYPNRAKPHSIENDRPDSGMIDRPKPVRAS
jgi:hypothetical protein